MCDTAVQQHVVVQQTAARVVVFLKRRSPSVLIHISLCGTVKYEQS